LSQVAGTVEGWKEDMLAKIDVVVAENSSGMGAKTRGVAFK